MHLHMTSRRVLASLVLLAAVGIVASKALQQQRNLGAQPSPEGAVPTVGANETGGDPFPATPDEQVQWVLRQQRPAMVLYHSNLCRPCRMMEALVQMVGRDYEPEVVSIEVVTDDPANAELLRWAGVGTIPASYFVSRSAEGKKVVGLMKQQDLRVELARLAAEGQSLQGTPTRTPVP